MKKIVPVRTLLPVYILVLTFVITLAHFGSRAVTVLSNHDPNINRKTIVIDAGHGGIDGGATSCTGILESQLNLEIAYKLRDLLNLMGYKTVMTRTTDTSIHTEGNTIAQQKISDLKRRVEIVNNYEHSILISIHQNTFQDEQYSGAQVFYAKHENSKILAQILQTSFISTLNPGSKRKCKPSDGIYLMQSIKCPGILVECGFLTNPKEEALLRSEVYQKKICCVVASGISQYFANTF